MVDKKFSGVLILTTILFLSVGFVSAGVFDFLKPSITGDAVSNLDNNLVSYWNFDNNFLDDGSANVDLTCSGNFCPTRTLGKSGFMNAGSFDGAGDVLEKTYNDRDDLSYSESNFAVSVWVKLEQKQSAQSIVEFAKYNNREIGNRKGIFIDQNGKPLILYGSSKYAVGNTPDLRDGEWHHLVVSYRYVVNENLWQRARIYVDGEVIDFVDGEKDLKANPATKTPGSYHAIAKVSIGKALTGQANTYAKGMIDDVRIYTTELNPRTVAELYEYRPSALNEKTCRADIDCKDQNDHTEDRCVNLECKNYPITCLNSLECQGSDPTKTYTCLNPGKADSKCEEVPTRPTTSNYHPADTNKNWKISLDEVTTYCSKIPKDNAKCQLSGEIWKNGEDYIWDSSKNEWVYSILSITPKPLNELCTGDTDDVYGNYLTVYDPNKNSLIMGYNPLMEGVLSLGGDTYQDVCVDANGKPLDKGGVLKEYYCDSDGLQLATVRCQVRYGSNYQCENAACVKK